MRSLRPLSGGTRDGALPVAVAPHQQAHAMAAPILQLILDPLAERVLHHRPSLRHPRKLLPHIAAAAAASACSRFSICTDGGRPRGGACRGARSSSRAAPVLIQAAAAASIAG
jgi:hypothetical protein